MQSGGYVSSFCSPPFLQLANRVLRAMLDGEDGAALQEQLDNVRNEVEEAGQWLVSEGHMEAARFMLVLRGMLRHQVIICWVLASEENHLEVSKD